MHQLLYPRFARFLLFWKMTREGAAKEGVPLPPQPSVMLMLMQVLLGFAAYYIALVFADPMHQLLYPRFARFLLFSKMTREGDAEEGVPLPPQPNIALVFADPMHQLLYHRFARFLLFSKMTREGDAEEGVPLPPQPSVMLMLMQVLLGFAAYYIALVFADPMHQLLYHRFARFLLFSKMTREGDAEEGVPLSPQPSVMLMLMQVLLGFAAYCIQYVASYMSFVYKFRLNAIM
ncbi:hypothetical protein Q3G72_020720 [Acer saccharum]|nr:hypothetical protein Q3G72_020720 [Acer saccharum]